MKALLVSYTLKNANINQKTTIHRVLYGYLDHSNNGTHKYEREGLLSKYPSIKLNRGVFIISLKNKNKIIPILRKKNASIIQLAIDIPETMLKKN